MPVHFDVDPILNASGVRIYILWRCPFDNCVRCSDKAFIMGLIFLSVFANLNLVPTDIKRLQKRTYKLGSYIKKLQTSRSNRFNTVILYFKKCYNFIEQLYPVAISKWKKQSLKNKLQPYRLISNLAASMGFYKINHLVFHAS